MTRDRRTRVKGSANGFSLLEVVLALAILAGSVVVLGELARLGIRHAQTALESTQAQLLCESKLAEIAAGLEPAEPSQGLAFSTRMDPEGEWNYAITVDPIDEFGLVAVEVTVSRQVESGSGSTSYTIVRWMRDPDLTSSEESTSTSGASASGGAGGGRG